MKKIHFIGIGGIGVSALARYFLSQGYEVSGTDIAESVVTEDLQRDGVKFYLGHHPEVFEKNTERVIYSAAVAKNDPELEKAVTLGTPIFTYSEALGELTKQYKTIAVSGSHGKGTTTALLSLMMIEAGLDPTVIIGTRLREFGGKNFRAGKGKYLLIEADEYNRSFWDYYPLIAVVTNVDAEHLDTFGDLEGVIGAFRHFIRNVPGDGAVIVNAGDKNSKGIGDDCRCRKIFFDSFQGPLKPWPLKVPGAYNQLNAEAAWKAAEVLGIERAVAEQAVKKFAGSWRRMEQIEPRKAGLKGTFFSDYAHHPTEIRATIRGLKEKFPKRKLLVVYQPHQTRRLTNLFEEFITCFDEAGELVLLPVYEVAGREDEKGKTSRDLYDALTKRGAKNIHYLQRFEDAFKLIAGQVVVFMGAGNIDADVRKYFRSKLLGE